MLIFVIAQYIIFAYIPMFGLLMAFENFIFSKGFFGSPFVGLTNFIKLFQDSYFTEALRNTFIIAGMRAAFCFVPPVIFALMLNEVKSKAFRSVTQTITYFPHFFSWVALSGLLGMLLAPDTGVINVARKMLGLQFVDYLSNNGWFRWILIITDIFKEMGWGSIIYIAAMGGINLTLYEAARIDGANRWHLLWHVTLPGIMPVISIMWILFVGSVFSQGFDQVYNLYNPVVYQSGDILDTYILRTLQSSYNLGLPAAAGMIKSVICLALLLAANWLVRIVNIDYSIY
jgi:putative aldouronate transport system permease protein